uniref:Uncharacterized protein n=1 Tax=Zooxanthella nutricula TaxID=1333877 RepID=A0A6V0K7G6_9DINO|mmetsp:Transcript_86793/g.265680  ORF Transcript_86793/g.265680 Transcript_86793/m.265680 type:complete len:345 (+) Transcript_86793:64-1098(+)
MAVVPLLVAALALGACGRAAGSLDSLRDLHSQYYNIFKTGNRNAASHLWASYILNRSSTMQAHTLEHIFRGFCAVSGSVIPDDARTMYKTTLPRVGGGTVTGVVRHCCWPCICDMNEHVRVDTKTVSTADGPHLLNVLVIGDPCLRPDELDKSFEDPFSGQAESLRLAASEVNCVRGKLSGALFSDHGHPIIGVFFTDPESLELAAASSQAPISQAQAADDPTFGYGDMCLMRKQQGYNSGMGLIFHLVASISPIPNSPALPLPRSALPLPTALAEKVEAAPDVRAPFGRSAVAANPEYANVAVASIVSGAVLAGVALLALSRRRGAARPGHSSQVLQAQADVE